MCTNLFEVEDQITRHQPCRPCFCRLGVVDPIRALWTVDIGQSAVQVDHLLAVGLQREFLNVSHIKAWRIVDRVDSNRDGLVRKLLSIACTKGDYRLAVDIVVKGMETKVVSSKLNFNHVRIGIVNDLNRKGGNVNGLTSVVRVREVLGEQEFSTTTFVNHLDGKASPTRLSIFNHVEQKCSVGQFTGIGVIASIVYLDFNALLPERASVVIGEDNLKFFGVSMPCNKVLAG